MTSTQRFEYLIFNDLIDLNGKVVYYFIFYIIYSYIILDVYIKNSIFDDDLVIVSRLRLFDRFDVDLLCFYRLLRTAHDRILL